MISWELTPKGVSVQTALSTYTADKLIISAGPWLSKAVPFLQQQLQVTRQIVCWAEPEDIGQFTPAKFSCWLIAEPDQRGALYGFPALDTTKFGAPAGLKFAWHHAGDPADPDALNRNVTEKEIRELMDRVAKYIPALKDAKLSTVKTCLYTNTPDEHFIIDHLPDTNGKVSVAGGFSGHGFKFVSVVGEILSQLALQGKTDLPAGFLSLKRFK
jgi:sarcosine oxidase